MTGGSVQACAGRRKVAGADLYVDDTPRANEWAEELVRTVGDCAEGHWFASVHVREAPGEEPRDTPAIVFHFDPEASRSRIRHELCFCTEEVTPELLRYLFAGRGKFAMDEAAKTVGFGGAVRALSGHQFRLIKELYLARSSWTSKERLLHGAFDTKHDEHSSIVRVHMRSLRIALGAFAPMIRSLHGVGYRLQIPRPERRTASGERPATRSGLELDCRCVPGDSECTKACGHGVRVLVVDDDAFSARWVARTLSGHGFECDLVQWWAGARLGLPGGHDVAVVDVFLGGDSGPTLAREMLDAGACRSVVLMSAFPSLLDAAPASLPGVLIDKGDGEAGLVHAVLMAADHRRGLVV